MPGALAVLRVGAGDAGRRDADVGGAAVDRERLAHAVGHLPGDLGMHGARGASSSASTPRSECFTAVCVGDHAAADDDARRPGTATIAAASEPAGQRLGDRDAQAARGQLGDDARGAPLVGDAASARTLSSRRARARQPHGVAHVERGPTTTVSTTATAMRTPLTQ